MMKLRLLFLYAFIVHMLCGYAQSSVMTISKDARQTATKELDGKSMVVFISKSDDIVINTTVNSDPVCATPEKTAKGYEYKMLLDISRSKDRVFNVSQKGTTVSEKTGQVLLRPNEVSYYNVELVDNPITMELDNDGSHYIQSGNGWALIEFNSEIKVTVTYSPKLKAMLKSGRSKAGAYVDSLIVNVEELQSLNNKLQECNKKLEELNKRYDEMLETDASDSQINAIEEEIKAMESQTEQKSRELDQLTYISIKGDGTNERSVDAGVLLSLNSKEKKKFNVMLLSKTVTVFKTQYEEMVHQAESHKKNRDYKSAKLFYESAAQAEGATTLNKQAALQSARKMDELAKFKSETDEKADRLYELSAGNKVVNKEQFVAMIEEIASHYDALNKETGDGYFKEEAERLRSQKNKIGLVIKGRCVASDYKGGKLLETPITNIRIYGSQQSDCEEMEKTAYLHKGETIAIIDAPDGTFSLTLMPGQYKTLIFEVVGNKKIKKNKHLSIEGRTDDRNVKIRFSMD